LKSTDGGNTWQEILSLPDLIMNFYIHDSIIYVLNEGKGIYIYLSLDYGYTWQEISREPSSSWLGYTVHLPNTDMVFFNKDTVYVYLPDSLLYTTDGFTTYTKQPYEYFGSSITFIKAKRFPNGNYCTITYSNHYGQSAAIYSINGRREYDFGGNLFYAIDGCCDSVFYIIEISCYRPEGSCIYTNRYFEPDTESIIKPENDFGIFPNPVEDKLMIENKQLLLEQISLFDLQGRLLFRANNINSYSYIIEMKQYISGMYFLQIQTTKGFITRKIIKK
jgi:hypothetical protein